MIEKRCSRSTTHKPHLWSRTTRKTVTEETAGDTLQCLGAVKAGVQAKGDTRGAEIAAGARSGTNWASRVNYGPACVCGAFPEGSTVTSWSQTIEKGKCHRHGTTQASRIARQ